MCYMLIGGKNAFANGEMLGGHNDDLFGFEASLLEIEPHTLRTDDEAIRLPTGPVIPVSKETPHCLMVKTFRGKLAGDTIAINEHGVCLMGGENLAVDRNDRAAAADPVVPNGVAGGARYVALLESKTARECVKKLGSYYSEYGNRFPCAVGIFDENEAWYCEGGGGSTWLAVRVPDDCYLVQSNGYRINEIDWDDTENVLYSEGLKEFVIEKGLWNPSDGPFNWAKAYGRKFLENPETYYYNSRRIWSALKLLSPSQTLSPDEIQYPTFMKPDQPITKEQIMALLRDTNAENAFSSFPESGQNTDVRPIGVPNCVHSAVVELHRNTPVAYGATLWSCVGSALAAPFLPHSFGITRIAPEFLTGSDSYSEHSAFWQFRSLLNLAHNDFPRYLPVLQKEWNALEEKTISLKALIDKEAAALYPENPDAAAELLTSFSEAVDYEALCTAKRLFGTLNKSVATRMYKVFAKAQLEW